MKRKLESFGFSAIKESQNWIPVRKVLKRGNFWSLRKSTKKLMKYVRQKIKMSHMLLVFMQMIFLLRESTPRLLSTSVKLQETLKKFSWNFYKLTMMMQEKVLRFISNLGSKNLDLNTKHKNAFWFHGWSNWSCTNLTIWTEKDWLLMKKAPSKSREN